MNKPFYYTVMAIIIGVSGYFIQKNWKQSSANLKKTKEQHKKPGGKDMPPMMQKGAEFTQEELGSFMDKLGDFSDEERKNVLGYYFGKEAGIDLKVLENLKEKAIRLCSNKW